VSGGGGGVGVGEGRVLWDLGRVGVDGLAGFSPSTGVLEAVWKAESPGIQSAGPPSNHSRDVLTPYAVEGTTEEADSSSDKLDDGSKPHAPTSAPIVCLQVLRNIMRAFFFFSNTRTHDARIMLQFFSFFLLLAAAYVCVCPQSLTTRLYDKCCQIHTFTSSIH
jgi:hypothetical protein